MGHPALAGVGERRLAAADIGRPFHGVRAIGCGTRDLRELCRAYSVRMRPGDAFSHQTAAVLLGLPLPNDLQADAAVHVARHGGSRPRAAGVVGHRVAAAVGFRTVSVAGVPVVDAASTWCMLAPVLRREDLVAVGDCIVSGLPLRHGRTRPLADPPDLAAASARFAGGRGARARRDALELIRTGVDSRPETHLRLLIVDAGLPEPAANRRAYDADGVYLGRPDLSYPELKISIEYEGSDHWNDPAVFARDIERYDRFRAAGWAIVRVSSERLYRHPDALVARIRRELAARGHRL